MGINRLSLTKNVSPMGILCAYPQIKPKCRQRPRNTSSLMLNMTLLWHMRRNRRLRPFKLLMQLIKPTSPRRPPAMTRVLCTKNGTTQHARVRPERNSTTNGELASSLQMAKTTSPSLVLLLSRPPPSPSLLSLAPSSEIPSHNANATSPYFHYHIEA